MSRYLELTSSQWDDKINEGFKILEKCTLCPNNCSINRIDGKKGICKGGFFPKVSSAFAHFGEEPPISGINGSGTIFFSGCTMKCVYCQNYPISQGNVGSEIPFEKLADLMIDLQNQQCHNINLVTPSHYIPQIIASLNVAQKKGLTIPIVYNTSSFETECAMRLLDGIVDIYLPDMRYSTNESAKKYSKVNNYVENVRKSIKEMARQVGELVLDKNDIAVSGLIVRLLVLPGLIDEVKDNLRFLAEEIDIMPYISLMNQYFPTWKSIDYPEINRKINEDEFMQAFSCMRRYGLNKGFVQDMTGC